MRADNPFLVPISNALHYKNRDLKLKRPLHYYIDDTSSDSDSIESDTESGDRKADSSCTIKIPDNNTCSELYKTNVFIKNDNSLWKRVKPGCAGNFNSSDPFDEEIFVGIKNYLNQTHFKRKRKDLSPDKTYKMKRKADSISDSDISSECRNKSKQPKLNKSTEKKYISNDSDSSNVFVKKRGEICEPASDKTSATLKNVNKHADDINQNSSADEGINSENTNASSNEMVSGTQEIDFSNCLPPSSSKNFKSIQHRKDSLSTSASSSDTDIEKGQRHELPNKRKQQTDSPDKGTHDITIPQTPKFMNAINLKPTSTPLFQNKCTLPSEPGNSTENRDLNQDTAIKIGNQMSSSSSSTTNTMPQFVTEIKTEHFEEDLLFSEDLSDNDEIWIGQCPRSLNLNSLLGVSLDLKEKTQFSATNAHGKPESYEAFASSHENADEFSEKAIGSFCLVPSRTLSAYKLSMIKPCGSITIQEDISVIPSCTISLPSYPKLPDNLRVRHPLLGFDYSKHLEEVETLYSNRSIKNRSKKNRRHSSSANDTVLENQDFEATVVKVEDDMSLEKHKKKHKEKRNRSHQDYTDYGQSYTNNQYTNNFNLDEIMPDKENIKDKKKKSKHKEIKEEVYSNSRFITNPYASNVNVDEIMPDREYKKDKKKKSKHKKKEEEVYSKSGYINNQYANNFNLDEIMPEKENKKDKKKKSKHKEIKEEVYSDSGYINNQYTNNLNLDEIMPDRENKKDKKKKSKHKEREEEVNSDSRYVNNLYTNNLNLDEIMSVKEHKKDKTKKSKHKYREEEVYSNSRYENYNQHIGETVDGILSTKKHKKKKKKHADSEDKEFFAADKNGNYNQRIGETIDEIFSIKNHKKKKSKHTESENRESFAANTNVGSNSCATDLSEWEYTTSTEKHKKHKKKKSKCNGTI